jgi:hypothetical protein
MSSLYNVMKGNTASGISWPWPENMFV